MSRWLLFAVGALGVLTLGSGALALVDADLARTVILSMSITIALGLGFLSLESFLDERLEGAAAPAASITAPTAALVAMGCTAAVVLMALTIGLGATDPTLSGPQVAGVQQVNQAELRVFGMPRDARMVIRVDGEPVLAETNAGLVELPDVTLDAEVEVLVLTGDDRPASCAVALGGREVKVSETGAATCLLD